MKKRILAFILLLCLLTSCNTKDINTSVSKTSKTEETISKATSTASSKEATTKAPATTAPTSSVKKQKIKSLSCVEKIDYNSYINDVMYAYDSVFCFTFYFDDKNLVCLVDVDKDKILKQINLDNSETLVGIADNQELIALNGRNNTYVHYDGKGNRNEFFTSYLMLPSVYNNKLYGIDLNGDVVSIDLKGNKSIAFKSPVGCQTVAYNLDKEIVVFTSDSDNNTSGRDICISNFKLDKLYYKDIDYNCMYVPVADGLIVQGFDDDSNKFTTHITFKDFKAEYTCLLNDQASTFYDGINPSCVLTYYDDPTSPDSNATMYELVDFNKRKSYDLTALSNKESFCIACNLKGTDRYVIVSPGDTHNANVIDLSLFEGDDLANYTPKLSEKPLYKCSEDLKSINEIKDKATAIEDKYHITILIGDEIKNIGDDSYYSYISMEDDWSVFSINYALDELDKVLQKYPEGFFDYFKTFENKGGLRIAIASNIKSLNYEKFTAAAVTFKNGGWYNIIIKPYSVSEETMDHEIWHATEERIEASDAEAFAESKWNQLNYDGFYYNKDFDNYTDNYNDLQQYILDYNLGDTSNIDPENDKIYFIYQYSTVNAHEDRATFCEWFDNMDTVCKHPHLKAKLDYMREQCIKTFGYVYWEKFSL